MIIWWWTAWTDICRLELKKEKIIVSKPLPFYSGSLKFYSILTFGSDPLVNGGHWDSFSLFLGLQGAKRALPRTKVCNNEIIIQEYLPNQR